MRKILLTMLVTSLLWADSAAARLQIFACEPEWGALASELGGELVSVFTATTAQQDPHHIQARPALIAQLRRADLAICTGAELEAGWLSMLQRRANNPRTAPGSLGFLEAAAQVELLERPQRLDRADGDVHASGNPHLHLDPRNIARVAAALSQRLIALDPGNADAYRRRGEDFQQRWQAAIATWEQRARPLQGMRIVVAHNDWVYLERWLGLQRIAALEPRPGIPPSSGHLATVLAKVQQEGATAVLYAAYQDRRPADWLAARSPVQPLRLPYTVGGSQRATDLFGLFDETIDLLLEALQ
ncbi:MAG: zinc ABC transporter solute-binding protein [Xanthomonadaceae bacterium]|nr:zinc ABC transporter solute-binding protein [Xanthomonadaceae bacterium]